MRRLRSFKGNSFSKICGAPVLDGVTARQLFHVPVSVIANCVKQRCKFHQLPYHGPHMALELQVTSYQLRHFRGYCKLQLQGKKKQRESTTADLSQCPIGQPCMSKLMGTLCRSSLLALLPTKRSQPSTARIVEPHEIASGFGYPVFRDPNCAMRKLLDSGALSAGDVRCLFGNSMDLTSAASVNIWLLGASELRTNWRSMTDEELAADNPAAEEEAEVDVKLEPKPSKSFEGELLNGEAMFDSQGAGEDIDEDTDDSDETSSESSHSSSGSSSVSD